MRRTSRALALAAALGAPGLVTAAAVPQATSRSAPGPTTAPQPVSDGVEAVTLEAAVSRALARNPTAAIAVEEVRRAQAVLLEVRAASLPALSLNAAYTRLDGDRVLAGRVIAAASQFGANLTLTVPLVSAKSWVQYSHAKDDVQTTRFAAEEARRQVAALVARAWLSLVAQHRVIEVHERAVETARAHLEFANKRYVGGYGTRLDAVRAEQELQTDLAQMQAARAQLGRLREALGVLLATDRPVDAVGTAELPAAPSEDEALGEAAAQRPDVRLARQRARAAHRVYKDRWADYLPSVVGVFQPFFQSPPTLTLPEWGWQAQIALSLPLFDGGLRYGQARERAALDSEARIALDAVGRQAGAEVRTALEELRRAADALAAAREAARLAREGLGLVDLAWKAGASTNIEVIDAERRSRDADTAVAVAEDASRQALLDLLIASGRFPAR